MAKFGQRLFHVSDTWLKGGRVTPCAPQLGKGRVRFGTLFINTVASATVLMKRIQDLTCVTGILRLENILENILAGRNPPA